MNPQPMERRPRRREAVKGGVVAGLIGGAVLSLFMLATNLMNGRDIWAGMKFAGLPFLGEAATQPGFAVGPVLVGLLSHLAVSIAWAVPFAWLAFGLSKRATIGFGALWGFVVWLGMFYAVLPLIGAAQMAQTMPVSMAIFEHVLFGLAVAIGFLPFQHPRHLRTDEGPAQATFTEPAEEHLEPATRGR